MRSQAATTLLIALLTIATGTTSEAQGVVDGFSPRTFVGANGVSMPFRLFVPDAKARSQPLPIVIYLHGSGGAGTDNLKQITIGNTNGTHVWTSAAMQARHPAFVVAPQMPTGQRWSAFESSELSPHARLVLELLASLSKEFAIDADRVYLTGQSLGGMGTWDILTKRPDLFAAGVPLCGSGTPSRVSAAKALPIWAFHGAKDDTVPVAGSRDLVAALRAVGGSIKYTEYPDAGHDIWTKAYFEKDLSDWLFAQKRPHR